MFRENNYSKHTRKKMEAKQNIFFPVRFYFAHYRERQRGSVATQNNVRLYVKVGVYSNLFLNPIGSCHVHLFRVKETKYRTDCSKQKKTHRTCFAFFAVNIICLIDYYLLCDI